MEKFRKWAQWQWNISGSALEQEMNHLVSFKLNRSITREQKLSEVLKERKKFGLLFNKEELFWQQMFAAKSQGANK